MHQLKSRARVGGGVQARVWVLRCEPHNGLEVQSLEERVAQLVGLARAIETVLDHPEVGRWDEDHLERARRQLSARYVLCTLPVLCSLLLMVSPA